MTRISEREFTRPPDQRARERLAFGHHFTEGDLADVDSPERPDWITTVQDVELGYRAAERLDFMEDVLDVRHWAGLAQLEAAVK
jgi:hypothetical protein